MNIKMFGYLCIIGFIGSITLVIIKLTPLSEYFYWVYYWIGVASGTVVERNMNKKG
jgi:hypothetical protein